MQSQILLFNRFDESILVEDQVDMKVAIIYFGITRSVEMTIDSIKIALSELTTNEKTSVYTFASLNLTDRLNSPRSREVNILTNQQNMFLLGADAYFLSRQDDISIAKYLNYAQMQNDVFGDHWSSIKNLLHALNSLQRAWDKMEEEFDFFLFIRPDLFYLEIIPFIEIISAFKGQGNIAVPSWHCYGGYNDRIAIADRKAARCYAKRIALVAEYCKHNSLHSETFLSYALDKENIVVWDLPVRAQRVRATGEIYQEDFGLGIRHLKSRSDQ